VRGCGPYLGCYLRLVDVDRRCILLDEPHPCHLVLDLERLVILLRQVVEGTCLSKCVVLVDVGSVGADASFLHG
jgi:hypothetical protein